MQGENGVLIKPLEKEERLAAGRALLPTIQTPNPIDLSKLIDPVYDVKSHSRIRVANGKYYVQGSGYLISLPSHVTEKLALFVGLFYGDGSLVSSKSAARFSTWRIDFAEGDKELVTIFARLGKEIFNLDFDVQSRLSWHVAHARNKIIYRFLSNICGHPAGRKTGMLHIPNIFRLSTATEKFLSGLFSTEGTVYPCYKSQPRIVIAMQEEGLMNEIYEELIRLGFSPTRNTEVRGKRRLHRVALYGFVQARMFKERIGFLGAKNKKLEMLLKQQIAR